MIGGLLKVSATAKRVAAGKRAAAANRLANPPRKRYRKADGDRVASESEAEAEDGDQQEPQQDQPHQGLDGDAVLAAVLKIIKQAHSKADKVMKYLSAALELSSLSMAGVCLMLMSAPASD